MAKKNERFKEVYTQSTFFSGVQVIVDTETGVNYVFMQNCFASGLTPLLDKDGKPVITPITDENK